MIRLVTTQMSGNLQKNTINWSFKRWGLFLKPSVNRDQLCSSSFIFSIIFSPILPGRLSLLGGTDTGAAPVSKSSHCSLLVHMEKMFICVYDHTGLLHRAKVKYLHTVDPFQAGAENCCFRQPQQALEGSGDH